jgi:hypothetical protein
MWMTKRAALSEPFGPASELPAPINPNAGLPSISADELTLFFTSTRPGGFGQEDLWMAKRSAISEGWSEPENLGAAVNSSASDLGPSISSDGLWLFFTSTRSGGYGNFDLWVAHRETKEAPFDKVANLGPNVNTRDNDAKPSVASDGSILYFMSTRQGGKGSFDLWRVPVKISSKLKVSGLDENGEFRFNVFGRPGIAYVIQRSFDLRDWLPWTVLTNPSPMEVVVESDSRSQPAAFYRAREAPR